MTDEEQFQIIHDDLRDIVELLQTVVGLLALTN